MRFTIPILFSSQLLLFLRALGRLSRRLCDKMQWDRLCVVCEEYVTNFFKYGRQGRLQRYCWFRIEIKGKQIRCLFSDAGKRFNPIEHQDSLFVNKIKKNFLCFFAFSRQ